MAQTMAAAVAVGELMIATPEQARELAAEGYTVVGSWENPTGDSGHVATVRPDSNLLMYANVGLTNGILLPDQAFGLLRPQILYYNPEQLVGL